MAAGKASPAAGARGRLVAAWCVAGGVKVGSVTKSAACGSIPIEMPAFGWRSVIWAAVYMEDTPSGYSSDNVWHNLKLCV